MQGSLDQPPIVVRASRIRAVWLVLGSAVFVAGGFLILAKGGAAVTAILTIGFFGLCGVMGLALLVAPARLLIGPSGLVQTVLWRTTTLAWTDVYNFRPALVGISTKLVGFDYLNGPPKRTGLRKLNTALAGIQGSLQRGWELAPDKLADLLNDARERWLSGAVETSERPLVSTPLSAPLSSPLGALAGARFNRKTYWIAVGGVFAVAIALAVVPGLQRGVSGLTTVLFVRVFAGRLHDLGRSGWWQLVPYGLMIAVLILAIAAKAPASLALGAAFLIQLAFTVGLGLLPGERGANRYGPPPGEPSPLAVSEAFR